MFRNSNRRLFNISNRQATDFDHLQPRKFKEKNILSAILGAATIVVLCSSLAEPVWFRLQGGDCCHTYLGVTPFLYSPPYDNSLNGVNSSTLSDCYGVTDPKLKSYVNCVDEKSITLIQVIIIFAFLAIFCSLFAFTLDIIAPRKVILWKVVKRYSFGYILTVLICATAVGFCYWASQKVFDLQLDHRLHKGAVVMVTFDVGVYLVTAAGCLAILATASNLMRQYPTDEEEQADLLLEEVGSADELEVGGFGVCSAAMPPAYTP